MLLYFSCYCFSFFILIMYAYYVSRQYLLIGDSLWCAIWSSLMFILLFLQELVSDVPAIEPELVDLSLDAISDEEVTFNLPSPSSLLSTSSELPPSPTDSCAGLNGLLGNWYIAQPSQDTDTWRQNPKSLKATFRRKSTRIRSLSTERKTLLMMNCNLSRWNSIAVSESLCFSFQYLKILVVIFTPKTYILAFLSPLTLPF